VQGCKRTPKRFDLSKIRAKSLKIWAKSLKIWAKFPKYLGKIPENPGKTGAQRCLILKKWRPTFAEKHIEIFFGGRSKTSSS